MNIEVVSQNYINALESLAKSRSQLASLSLFKGRGLPTTKMEEWIYTKLTDVLPYEFHLTKTKGEIKSIKVAGKYQLVLLNGKFSKEDSFLPDELEVKIISAESSSEKFYLEEKNDLLAHLNASAASEIIEITLPKKVILDDFISIVHLSNFSGEFATPRLHITCEKFSQGHFIEIFTGDALSNYNNISVTNFDIQTAAIINHTKVQIEGSESFHFGSLNAVVANDAIFNSFTFNSGAKKSRNNICVKLEAQGAKTSVHGLYAQRGSQHCDNFTTIEHNAAHTESAQLFKGILDDSSRGVFTGKVFVAKDAQKINSEQLNKNLILSKKAHADSRPQLEVNADDVKCSHGATIGQMNPEEAFYLMSRGLSKERCQKLLIHAFCSDVLSKIDNEKLETFLSEILFESFESEVFKHISATSELEDN